MSNFDNEVQKIEAYIKLAEDFIGNYYQFPAVNWSTRLTENNMLIKAKDYADYARNALIDLTKDPKAGVHAKLITDLNTKIGFIYEDLQGIQTDYDKMMYGTNCAFIDSTFKK